MLKVIIVDDEILSIDLLARFLGEFEQIQVTATFTRAHEALEFVRKDAPDVVFLDIEMPDIDGIHLGELLRSGGMLSDIVYVTAYDHYAIQAFEVQATDYLMKPIEQARLAKTIQTIMYRRNTSTLPAETQKKEVAAAASPSGKLAATLIGTFVLYDADGQPIRWRTKKVKELCAYLLHQDQAVHRYQVIDDLWPNTSLDKAVSLLYTTVYQLRRTFHYHSSTQAIAYVDERYSLMIDVSTDIQQVQNILRQDQFDDRQMLDLLEWTSKEYLGQEDYPWSLPQQAQFKAECIKCLEKYALAAERLHEANDTWLLCMNRLLQLAPYNETYCKMLIDYHQRQGDHRKARDIQLAYQEWHE